MHLTAEQDGIYRRLIDHYMETGGPLPDNDIALARIASVSIETWNMAAVILRPYFCHADGMLRHKKCDAVLAEQAAFQTKQSEKGRAGASARWAKAAEKKQKNSSGHATAIAQAMPNDATIQDNTGNDSKESISPPTPSSASAPASSSERVGNLPLDKILGSPPTYHGTEIHPRFKEVREYITKRLPHLDRQNATEVNRWLSNGADPELDIFPTVDHEIERKGRDIGSFKFFTRAIESSVQVRKETDEQMARLRAKYEPG